MREGTGTALATVRPAAAFAYLADPRHATEWFAGVTLVEAARSAAQGAPRAGMTWRFRQLSGRVVPVRMAIYEPPVRFVWETARRWPADNLAWEVRCEPAERATGAAGEQGERAAAATRLVVTIRQRPGPLGWLSLLLARSYARRMATLQAVQAAERARDAVQAVQAHSRDSGQPRPRRGWSGGRR